MGRISLIVLAAALIVALAGFAAADTATTVVNFNVPSSVSFTVTLPGQSGVASGSTAQVDFNSSAPTRNKINGTVVNGGSGGGAQTDLIPIFNYSNTGNRDINVTLLVTSGAVPTQVKLKAGQNNSAWIAGCTCTNLDAGNCPRNDCAYINSTVTVKVANVTYGGYQEVWLWADFSLYMGGSSGSATVTHTSQAS